MDCNARINVVRWSMRSLCLISNQFWGRGTQRLSAKAHSVDLFKGATVHFGVRLKLCWPGENAKDMMFL